MYASGRVKPLQCWGLLILAAACGGRTSEGGPNQKTEDDDGPQTSSGVGGQAIGVGGVRDPGSGGSLATGGSPNLGGSAEEDGGSGGTLMMECVGDACDLSPLSDPLWTQEVEGYGRGPAWIRFEDGDGLVQVGVGETSFVVTTLDPSTGSIQGEPLVSKRVVASDSSGRRIVVDEPNEGATVLVDGAKTMNFYRDAADSVSFSPDGAALTHISCSSVADQLIQIDVFDTTSGEVIVSTEVNLPCFYVELATLVDAERRRTLFGHPASGDLFLLDWDTKTVTQKAIHEQAAVSNMDPRNIEGTILNLALDPDGKTLLSIGAADGLAWLDVDSLQVQDRLAEVPYFNVYDACYCDYHSESPVAWSPSGDVLAAAAPDGGIALYDAATHQLLEELAPPSLEDYPHLTLHSTDLGPVLFEFAPDMRHLIALYPTHVVGYSLRND